MPSQPAPMRRPSKASPMRHGAGGNACAGAIVEHLEEHFVGDGQGRVVGRSISGKGGKLNGANTCGASTSRGGLRSGKAEGCGQSNGGDREECVSVHGICIAYEGMKTAESKQFVSVLRVKDTPRIWSLIGIQRPVKAIVQAPSARLRHPPIESGPEPPWIVPRRIAPPPPTRLRRSALAWSCPSTTSDTSWRSPFDVCWRYKMRAWRG